MANKIDRSIPSSTSWARKFKNKKDIKVFEIVNILKKLGIKIAICSNTIGPHATKKRTAGIYDLFPIVILSHEVGYRKPDAKIYEITLNKLGVKPKEVIFVDDSEENVTAAEKLGMKGIVIENAVQLQKELKKFEIYVKGFKEFVFRGNVIDLAVAVVIGAAFGKIVNVLIADLITPLIGVFGGVPNFFCFKC